MSNRRSRERARRLPLALDEVARALRAGKGVAAALADAADLDDGELGGELRAITGRIERGVPVAAAIEQWGREADRADVALAVAALVVGIEVGGARARPVETVAATLRDRLAAADVVAAETTTARLSAVVMVVLPVAFGGLAMLLDDRVATVVLQLGVGSVCVGVGIALDVLGALWMRALVRRASW